MILNPRANCRKEGLLHFPAEICLSLQSTHTEGVVRQHAFQEGFLDRFSRRVLRRCLVVGSRGRKGSEKGSWKRF